MEEAARCLRAGGLVAFPTETVYGLGANAFDQVAVEHIFRAKERPNSDPIIVHISQLEQLYQVAEDVSPLVSKMAKEFWPGPLTIIQKRSPQIPSIVSAGLDTVAIRFPSHPVALALIRLAGVPVAAPSANLFTRPSATTAQHVIDDLGGRVDIILDGGQATIGLESSIVDLVSVPPVLLRPGGVAVEALRRLAPDLVIVERYLRLEDQEAASAPGQLSRHYSPRARLYIVKGKQDENHERMRSIVDGCLQHHLSVGVLAVNEDLEKQLLSGVEYAALGPKSDLEAIGTNLFIRIRELDEQKVDVMLIGEFEIDGIGLAIRDRLLRASEGRVIESFAEIAQNKEYNNKKRRIR